MITYILAPLLPITPIFITYDLSGFPFADTGNGREGDHLLFHSATPTRSQTFRHLFSTLNVRRLSRNFNRTACI